MLIKISESKILYTKLTNKKIIPKKNKNIKFHKILYSNNQDNILKIR